MTAPEPEKPLLANELTPFTVSEGGRPWFAVRARGWFTGWCSSIGAAHARVVDWFDDRLITENPLGQASTEEIAACAAWLRARRMRLTSLSMFASLELVAAAYSTLDGIRATLVVERATDFGFRYAEPYKRIRRSTRRFAVGDKVLRDGISEIHSSEVGEVVMLAGDNVIVQWPSLPRTQIGYAIADLRPAAASPQLIAAIARLGEAFTPPDGWQNRVRAAVGLPLELGAASVLEADVAAAVMPLLDYLTSLQSAESAAIRSVGRAGASTEITRAEVARTVQAILQHPTAAHPMLEAIRTLAVWHEHPDATVVGNTVQWVAQVYDHHRVLIGTKIMLVRTWQEAYTALGL